MEKKPDISAKTALRLKLVEMLKDKVFAPMKSPEEKKQAISSRKK